MNNNSKSNRQSKEQRRLSSKSSLEETNDKIKSNRLKNEEIGSNDELELEEDTSKDQLEISEGTFLNDEKEIKGLHQSVSVKRKRRKVLIRDKTLEIVSSAETETDDVNEVNKVFDKDEEIFSTISNNSVRTSANRRARNKSRKRKKDHRTTNVEIPITEILRKYEEPSTPVTLTANKIYVQGDNGFSTIKIITKDDDRKNTFKFLSKNRLDKQICLPIGIAVLAQKLFKRTAFVYQGFLGGTALVHLIMIRFFFETSMDFISKYSFFSEIYSSLFSLLIVLSVVSTFDKFDLAHLDLDRLRDIFKDYVGSAIAIPFYLTTLCLHETYANLDDKLSLIHYHDNVNNTLWNNNTMPMEEIYDELTSLKKINMSKDLLALLGWIFTAIGIKDDALLLHLESMQGSTQTM